MIPPEARERVDETETSLQDSGPSAVKTVSGMQRIVYGTLIMIVAGLALATREYPEYFFGTDRDDDSAKNSLMIPGKIQRFEDAPDGNMMDVPFEYTDRKGNRVRATFGRGEKNMIIDISDEHHDRVLTNIDELPKEAQDVLNLSPEPMKIIKGIRKATPQGGRPDIVLDLKIKKEHCRIPGSTIPDIVYAELMKAPNASTIRCDVPYQLSPALEKTAVGAHRLVALFSLSRSRENEPKIAIVNFSVITKKRSDVPLQ